MEIANKLKTDADKQSSDRGHPNTNGNKRKRSRNITYFNPPFSMLLKTNITKEVNRIIKECFPKDNVLSKIINKNTIQIGYCTTANLG